MESSWEQRLGFWWIAEDHPEWPAVLESPDGPCTYAELAARAHRLVHLLRARGLQLGDAVAALLPNGIDIVTCSLACHEAGWFFIPLNTFLTGGEIAAILQHSGARVLVTHEQLAERVADFGFDRGQLAGAFSVGAIDGFEPLADALAPFPITEPEDRRTGSLFVYTSGTTGKPKGIRRPLREGDPSRVANDASVFGRAFDFLPFGGPHLVSTAMYHGGSHSYYMGALNVGHSLVVMPRFDAEETLRLIERHRVYSAYMVPTQFHRLLRLPAEVRAHYDVSSLHSVVHSAAPCPVEVKQRMLEWWGPVIWETYGGMEGPATIAKPARWLEKPGTVGRAIRGTRLRILDDDGNELPAGEIGGIYYGSDDSTFEYAGDEATTRAAYRGSFFTIGDVGYLDDDGYLFICDRAKDMIITGGVNVYPQEVEAVLVTHPAVGDAAVIGLPDEEWGERVVAIVEPAAGHEPSDALANELIELCRGSLAKYKCPRTIEFRATLPRTDAGKLYKRQLRAEFTNR
jgi:long-chain acyl-CoA synthetase